MDKQQDTSNEERLWKLYLETCRDEGVEPTPENFAKWAKSIIMNGSP